MKKLKLFTIPLIFSVFFISLSTITLAGFTDVDMNHDYFDAISYLESVEFVSGYSDSTFKPDNPITRGELTKMVVNGQFNPVFIHEPVPKCNVSPFPDVSLDNKFIDYICKAKEQGIVTGYSDGTYRVDDYITVGESIKIIDMGVDGGNNSNQELPILFNSERLFMPYIESLRISGALPISMESIDENVTRGEVAEMVYRLKLRQSIYKKSTNSSLLYGIDKETCVNVLSTNYSEANGTNIQSIKARFYTEMDQTRLKVLMENNDVSEINYEITELPLGTNLKYYDLTISDLNKEKQIDLYCTLDSMTEVYKVEAETVYLD